MSNTVRCGWCEEPLPDDVMLHPECVTRSIVGGLNHLKKLCPCYGGDAPPDPPGFSIREAAKLAADQWRGMQW